MTLKIEQEIDNFIKNIRVLEMAKDGMQVLQYVAQHNNSKALEQFDQAHNLIDDAYKNLMDAIKTQKETDVIAKNIGETIAIIKNIPDKIPNETELLNMLESCNQSFSPAKMLNVFSWLRRFTLRLPSSVNRHVAGELRRRRSPLRTGLLTGLLLGCGPLQAMYVMAAGSGDPKQGAMILLMFGLGTLLPLLGFGVFASLLSPAVMRQMVRVSGILVIAMGLMMAQRGWNMVHTAQSMSTMSHH